jgi:hypothetical protein
MHGQRAIGAGIVWCAVGVTRPGPAPIFDFGDNGCDFGAAEEGRVEQSEASQFGERCLILCKMFRLAANRFWPLNAKPGEVFSDRGFEFGPCTRDIDVLDAQQEDAATRLREAPVEHGRPCVSDMEQAVRAGGESDNRLGHVWFRVGVVFGHDISWHFSQAPSPGLM